MPSHLKALPLEVFASSVGVMQDALADSSFKPQFAGHETFPLRLLWLKKAHDAVAYGGADRRTFQEQSVIARFGVGKNMAISMRHWALAAGVLTDDDAAGFRVTELGEMVLGNGALDPYLEEPATLWLVHLAIAGAPEMTTTFFYVFNALNQSIFDREGLAAAIGELAASRGARATAETIKRDIEVFLRSYIGRGEAGEDAAEPLLAELGLVREQRLANQYEFVRGPKPSLPDGVFAVALRRFWRRWHQGSPTISAEQATYAPGSPGRVFKLDEDSVIARLAKIDQITSGALVWTDTAGLRQVNFTREIDEAALIRSSYPTRKAA